MTLRKYKFYFKSGEVGTLRTDQIWDKKAVKKYNETVGKFGGIIKVKPVKYYGKITK